MDNNPEEKMASCTYACYLSKAVTIEDLFPEGMQKTITQSRK